MMNKTSRLVLLGLWLLSLITLLIFGVLESKSFAISAKQNSLEILEEKSTDTLKVYLNKEHKYKETVTVFNHFTLIEDDAENRYRLDENIRMNIKESKGDKIELSLDKNARGWRQEEALKNAKSIEYSFDYYDHQLVIDGYWLSPIESKNNPESVRLNLLLPEGQYIYLDQDLGRYLSNQIENDQDYYRKRIAGHLWKMENGSLVCQDCTALEGTVKFDEEEFKINLSDEDTSLEVNIDENGVKIQKKENN